MFSYHIKEMIRDRELLSQLYPLVLPYPGYQWFATFQCMGKTVKVKVIKLRS